MTPLDPARLDALDRLAADAEQHRTGSGCEDDFWFPAKLIAALDPATVRALVAMARKVGDMDDDLSWLQAAAMKAIRTGAITGHAADTLRDAVMTPPSALRRPTEERGDG